jgi:hypothetical protein
MEKKLQSSIGIEDTKINLKQNRRESYNIEKVGVIYCCWLIVQIKENQLLHT